MVDFKGGRLPNDPTKPRLKLNTILKDTVAYPPSVDYLSRVSNWPMYLNDRIGDCTCAAMGHIIEAVTTYGQNSTVQVTDNDVLNAYRAVSGYDPATGANDNGAVVQDVLNYWRKTGIAGHKILAFAEVDVTNLSELRVALSLFGTLYLGIDFPNTAMDQFDAGQPWDVVPGATNEGGHAINAGFYDVASGTWKIVTWGKVQPMTQAFWDQYVKEAWIVITPEWFNAQGTNVNGIDEYALGEQFKTLTGEANPFPAPVTPTPTPEPTPAPTPVPDNPQPVPTPAPTPTPTPVPPTPVDADQALADYVTRWLAAKPVFYRKTLQVKLRQWLATR